MRKKIVAGNWKMNKNLEESKILTSELVNILKDELLENVTVVLAPPFINLETVSKFLRDSSNVFLAAQNCSQYEYGAYTGEVSVAMLKSVNADFVILGHSERREYFKESNESIKEKVSTVLENKLTPIFCCGELLEIREKNEQDSYVHKQIEDSLFHLSEAEIKNVVLAYEPIWAIGTGQTASAEQAQEMHKSIRDFLKSKYGESVAEAISILYGGSCKPSNAKEIFACKDVDGGLIGGASLKSRDFVDIIKAI